MSKNICVIPARGGSKRIKDKNIREFCGRPIIGWIIEKAKECNCFDEIYVSTDSQAIKQVAEEFGATVPFIRPTELSGDELGTGPVIKHLINYLEEGKEKLDIVCCLYATAVMIEKEDLIKSMNIFLKLGNKYKVFAATEYDFSVYKSFICETDGQCQNLFDASYFSKMSQEISPVYHDAGQFYWNTSKGWKRDEPICERSRAMILPRHRAIDIDTEEDWIEAEFLFQNRLK